MAGEVELHLEGLDGYRQRLDAAEAASGRELGVLTVRAARLVRDGTRRRVPRGPTGRARASVRILEAVGTVQVVAGGRTVKYYGWLEYGGIAGADGPRRPYRPQGRYLLNAYRDAAAEIDDATGRALERVVATTGLDG